MQRNWRCLGITQVRANSAAYGGSPAGIRSIPLFPHRPERREIALRCFVRRDEFTWPLGPSGGIEVVSLLLALQEIQNYRQIA